MNSKNTDKFKSVFAKYGPDGSDDQSSDLSSNIYSNNNKFGKQAQKSKLERHSSQKREEG